MHLIVVFVYIFRRKNTLLGHFIDVFPVTYPQILTIYFNYVNLSGPIAETHEFSHCLS